MISLRDDEDAAVDALKQISRQQECPADVDSLKRAGRLDVLYFWPGYISPEEFMHRIVVAVQGMIADHNRRDGRDIIAVLNGIDHLAARHPLCAEESMFVPAVVFTLLQQGVTAVVIAATDERGSAEASGLLPMADLLLRFSSGEELPEWLPPDAEQPVEVVAQRVPAGGVSGYRGCLYRSKGGMMFAVPPREEGQGRSGSASTAGVPRQ